MVCARFSGRKYVENEQKEIRMCGNELKGLGKVIVSFSGRKYVWNWAEGLEEKVCVDLSGWKLIFLC